MSALISFFPTETHIEEEKNTEKKEKKRIGWYINARERKHARENPHTHLVRGRSNQTTSFGVFFLSSFFFYFLASLERIKPSTRSTIDFRRVCFFLQRLLASPNYHYRWFDVLHWFHCSRWCLIFDAPERILCVSCMFSDWYSSLSRISSSWIGWETYSSSSTSWI